LVKLKLPIQTVHGPSLLAAILYQGIPDIISIERKRGHIVIDTAKEKKIVRVSLS
jgi:hypothetical protein